MHHMFKHYETTLVHPYSSKLSNNMKNVIGGVLGLGDFNMTIKPNKQTNKQTTLILNR